MPKQHSIIKITGSLDGICYYKSRGQYLCRRKGGVSKEQILNNPNFQKFREGRTRLQAASRLASCIWAQLSADQKKKCEWNKMCKQVLHFNKQNLPPQEVIIKTLFAFYIVDFRTPANQVQDLTNKIVERLEAKNKALPKKETAPSAQPSCKPADPVSIAHEILSALSAIQDLLSSFTTNKEERKPAAKSDVPRVIKNLYEGLRMKLGALQAATAINQSGMSAQTVSQIKAAVSLLGQQISVTFRHGLVNST